MARQRKIKPPTWTAPSGEGEEPAREPRRVIGKRPENAEGGAAVQGRRSRAQAAPRRRGRRAKATVERALALAAQGRADEAQRELEDALRATSDDTVAATILMELGHLHRAAGRWHEAESAYKKAVGFLEPGGESPQLTACVTALAETVRRQQRRVEAEDLLDVAWVMMLRDTDPFAEVAAAQHPSQVFRAALKAAVTHLSPGRAHLFYRGLLRGSYGEAQLDSPFVADVETGYPVLEVASRGPGLALRSQLTRAGLSSVAVVPWGTEGHLYVDRPPGAPYLEAADLTWLQRLGALVSEKLEGADLAPSEPAWRSQREKGLAHLQAGQLREARLTLEGALNLAELWGIGDARRGVTLLDLGHLHSVRKRKAEAVRLLREGLECCSGWPQEEAGGLTALASLLGPGAEAEALLDRALVLTLQTQAAEAPTVARVAVDEGVAAAPPVLAAPILPWERAAAWVAPAAEVGPPKYPGLEPPPKWPEDDPAAG